MYAPELPHILLLGLRKQLAKAFLPGFNIAAMTSYCGIRLSWPKSCVISVTILETATILVSLGRVLHVVILILKSSCLF